jgi:hypothetical protein
MWMSADVFFAGQLFDRDILVRIFFPGKDVEGEALACLVEHTLRLLGLFEQVSDLRERCDTRENAVAEQARDLIKDH